MKTIEFIKKYKLDVSDKFDHSEFVKDLASDFIVLLELNKANDNLKGFDNALRCIRMKYDSISNKTKGIIPEKLWNFFFATVVVKLREEMCPKDMEKKRKLQEEKKRQWEQRQAYQKWEEKQYSDFWEQNFYSFLFSRQKTNKPTEHFKILGLADSATIEEVKTTFKQLAHKHHPDKGGNQEKFIEITDAKNKCLNYLENL